MSDESNNGKLDKVHLFMTNLALAAAGLACLAKGVLMLWSTGDAAMTGVALTAGLTLLLASTMDRFEELKGLGIEAKTRKLDAAISQANATLDQLRELAELSSGVIVQMSAKMGRWDSAPTAKEAWALVRRVHAHLKSIGSSDTTIREILTPWADVTTKDLLGTLLKEPRRQIQLGVQDATQRLNALPQPIADGDPAYQKILEEQRRFSAFEPSNFGNPHSWPLGTHAIRLKEYVARMPLLNESDRGLIESQIAPWLARIDHLSTKFELQDEHEWFSLQQD